MDFAERPPLDDGLDFSQFFDFDLGENNSDFLSAEHDKVGLPGLNTDSFTVQNTPDLPSKDEQSNPPGNGFRESNPDPPLVSCSRIPDIAGGRQMPSDGPGVDEGFQKPVDRTALVDAPAFPISPLLQLNKKRKFAQFDDDSIDPALKNDSMFGLQSPVPVAPFDQESGIPLSQILSAQKSGDYHDAQIDQDSKPAVTPLRASASIGHLYQQDSRLAAFSPNFVQQPATMSQGTADLFKLHLPPSILRPRALRPAPTRVPWTNNPKTTLTKHGHVRATTHNTDLGDAMPYNIELPNCPELGAMEIIAYLPNHLTWPELLLRLIAAGWHTETIAEYALYVRGRLTVEAVHRVDNKLRKMVSRAGNSFFNTTGFSQKKFATQLRSSMFQQGPTTYNVAHIQPPVRKGSNMAPCLLSDLRYEVVNHPTGEDRGILTQVILYDQNGNGPGLGLTTDDVQYIANRQGFAMPRDAQVTTDWDTQARDRAVAIIKAQPGYKNIWR